MTRLRYAVSAVIGGLAVILTTPANSQAQDAPDPRNDESQVRPAQIPPEYLWSIEESLWRGTSIGEDYTLELNGGLWDPIPTFVASSEQFGITGTKIDFTQDLGMIRKRHPELRMTYKPGRRHKLRLHWLPIQYTQSAVLQRQLVFQGIAFNAGVPVNSTIRWDAWRLGYEFDFVSRERGYFGIILEAKYTQIHAQLNSEIDYEFARARAPIPAIGAIGRVYVTRFTPITAEFTAFRLPDNAVEGYEARYVDFNIFGTVNLSKMVGVDLGYRSIDLSYLADRDAGDMKLDGIYLLGVFRF